MEVTESEGDEKPWNLNSFDFDFLKFWTAYLQRKQHDAMGSFTAALEEVTAARTWSVMEVDAAFTSFGTTSPRYMRQQAMYLPCLGSHLAIMFDGSKTALVISGTDSCSWNALEAEMTDSAMSKPFQHATKEL
ncbi:hypothetical protein Ahy_B06g084220 [Arachis hypogaea]|uniref:Uncharacterized protein n=1 Tax=Arachis hypogaea TaxID=3818 RepID=A0A444YRD8_ARAHY|nr:hypothetical protein Ahy_B06g084220 [Arachis hypogaea]